MTVNRNYQSTPDGQLLVSIGGPSRDMLSVSGVLNLSGGAGANSIISPSDDNGDIAGILVRSISLIHDNAVNNAYVWILSTIKTLIAPAGWTTGSTNVIMSGFFPGLITNASVTTMNFSQFGERGLFVPVGTHLLLGSLALGTLTQLNSTLGSPVYSALYEACYPTTSTEFPPFAPDITP